MAEGFLGFDEGSQGGFLFGAPPSPRSELTDRQLIMLALGKERKKKWSLGKILKEGALDPVTWTMDKLLRPSYAVANAIDEGFRGDANDFSVSRALHGAYRGFTGKEKEGFGEVLSNYGLLDNNKTLRGIAGFGLDVLTDPLMALSVAAAPVTGGASIAGYSAARATSMAAGRKALEGVADRALIETLEQGGKEFSARAALARKNVEVAEKYADDVVPSNVEAVRSILRAGAQAEERAATRYVPQIRIGTRKHAILKTPTHIGGKRIVPVLPKLEKIGGRGIPVVSRLVDATGRAFKPGYSRPELYSMELTRQHVAEELNLYYRDLTEQMLGDAHLRLSPEDMADALHMFEQPAKRGKKQWKAITKHPSGEYILNPSYVKMLKETGSISDDQLDFVTRWHNIMDGFNKFDKRFGIDYKNVNAEGRLYVPHIIRRDGTPLDEIALTNAQKSLLTTAGFERARGKAKLSLSQLHDLAKQGKLPKDVITNPYELLTHAARKRGARHADKALINSFEDAYGIPTKIVNPKRVERAAKAVDVAEKNATRATKRVAEIEERISLKRDLYREELESQFEETISRLEAQYSKIKYGKKTRTKKATLSNIARRIEKARADLGEQLTLVEKNVRKITAADRKELTKARADLRAAKTTLRSAQSGLNKARKGSRNPALSNVETIKVPGAKDVWGNSYAFKPEVGAAMKRVEAIVTGDDKTIEDFARGWGKWVANWKLLVTSINPGYRVRNTLSDFWGMWVSGVPMWAIARYGKEAAEVMAKAKRGDIDSMKIIVEAAHQGVLSGLYTGDIQSVAKYVQYSGSKRALIKDRRFIKLSTKIAQDLNRNAENWARLTHFMYRRKNLKQSVTDAAFQVKKAHFDYEELTPFEQRRMKNLIPFYTWTRKNIPFQIQMIVQNPGRWAAFPKAAQEAEFAAGGSDSEVPDFLSAGLGFKVPLGENRYLLPQIGAADLGMFTSPGNFAKRVAGMVNPAFKVPAELALNKSAFTGAEIAGDHPRNPVSNIGAGLLSLIPGSDVGQTSRLGPGGERLEGPGANPYYAYLLGQLPLLRQLGINSSGIKAKQGDNLSWLSYVGGLSVQDVDPELQQLFARLSLEEEADKVIKGLRDEGLLPPAEKRKKSEKDKLLDAIAFSKS